MHPNFNYLLYFHAVDHEGNLTNAARRLNLSQSALSTQIRLLEESIGHDLFERRGRRLELIATFSADAGHARRHLRIGTVANLSRNFQIQFLAPMLARDDVHLVIRTGTLPTLVNALDAHEIDMLLTNRLPFRDSATTWRAR